MMISGNFFLFKRILKTLGHAVIQEINLSVVRVALYSVTLHQSSDYFVFTL